MFLKNHAKCIGMGWGIREVTASINLIKKKGFFLIKKIGISLTAAKPPAERSEANKVAIYLYMFSTSLMGRVGRLGRTGRTEYQKLYM